MDKETIDKYLKSRANLLNGQLRGAINHAARHENQQLIELTLSSIFEDGITLGRQQKEDEHTLQKLKNELKDEDNT